MSDAVELKPCPNAQCGGKNVGRCEDPDSLTRPIWFECFSCGCRGRRAKTEAEAIAAWNTRPPEAAEVTGAEFAPCPTCRQYSHSIGEDKLAAAFMVFQSMFSHRNDGIPTQFCFDEQARDAAQVLMTAARQQHAPREPRAFPDAADGTPTLPMEAEIWSAGADLETAKFVARVLGDRGYRLEGGPDAPTHRCKVCLALWRQWDDGTWTLRSGSCGKCCDNAPMGDQIEPLSPEPQASIRDAALVEAAAVANALADEHGDAWHEEKDSDERDRLTARHDAVRKVADAILGRIDQPAPRPEALAPDLVRLVIAARKVAFETTTPGALHELDQASEAFAAVVPWDNQP